MKKKTNNPWEVLNISPNASLQEIKNAYHKLAKQHHPDGGGTIKNWLSISKAYDDIMLKRHIPVVTAPSTQMINLSLSINQQVNGIDEIICIDKNGEEVYINITIPPGALKDDKFYVNNGNEKYIVNIRELSHPEFQRHGLNLTTYKILDIVSVLKRQPFMLLGPTGDYIEVDLPDNIDINNSIITVPGQGLYSRKSKKRGSLKIHVKVRVPVLSEDKIEEFITRLKND